MRRSPLWIRFRSEQGCQLRVRKAEETARDGWTEPELHRIARPKASTKGPFGNVYPISEVEGISAHRIERLRRILKPSDSLFLAVAFAAFRWLRSAR